MGIGLGIGLGLYRGIGHGAGAGAVGGLPPFDGTLDLDFTTGVLDPRITFTHADDNSWRRNSAGILVPALTDEPRFDFGYKTPDAGSPSCEGLLIETNTTNICLHSDDLTNVAWTKSNATAAKDQVGPDGVSNSASSLTATAANGTCLQAITQASAARTFQCYIKRLVGSGNIQLTHDAGSTWTTVTVTSGWTLVSVTQTIANSSVGFRIVTSGDSVAIAFCMDATMSRPHAPIRTAGSTVTRAVDDAAMTGANFTDWFTSGPGTLFVEWKQPETNFSAVRAACAINDGSNNNHYNILVDTGTGTGRFQESLNGAVDVSITIDAVPAANAVHKYGMAWDTATGVHTNANGTGEGTDASATEPTGLNQLLIGKYSTGINRPNAWIRKIKYWPRKLSVAELDLECT